LEQAVFLAKGRKNLKLEGLADLQLNRNVKRDNFAYVLA